MHRKWFGIWLVTMGLGFPSFGWHGTGPNGQRISLSDVELEETEDDSDDGERQAVAHCAGIRFGSAESVSGDNSEAEEFCYASEKRCLRLLGGLPEIETDTLAYGNEELFFQHPVSRNRQTEFLRRVLLFFFDGRLATQKQFDLVKHIKVWFSDMSQENVDELFLIAIDNGWGYLTSSLLRVLLIPPSLQVVSFALKSGQVQIAYQLIENSRIRKCLEYRGFSCHLANVYLPKWPILQGPFPMDAEYLCHLKEALINKLLEYRFISKEDARVALKEIHELSRAENSSPRGFLSPRSLSEIRSKLHRRSRSFFTRAPDKSSIRRNSKSAESSPRDNETE